MAKPRPAPVARSRAARPPRRRRTAPVAVVVAALLLTGCTASPGGVARSGGAGDEVVADGTAPTPVAVTVEGLSAGDLLSADALADLVVTIAASDGSTPRVLLDGVAVGAGGAIPPGDAESVGAETATADAVGGATGPAVLDGAMLAALGDGDHVLVASVDGGATTELHFGVDTTPPTVELAPVVEGTGLRAPMEVSVTVGDASTVAAAGAETVLHDDGTATLTWPRPPREVEIVAHDTAGNATAATASVVVPFPYGRAVHVTPSAWSYGPKREPIIDLLEQGLVDAIQLDIKDELGDVAWDTDVPWTDLSGAEDYNRNFDIRGAIDTIHSYGARVIGRLTVYRDTRLARWAWESGRRDLVLQTTDGEPYSGRYGDYAFTNFAHPDVQQYNLDIALEAAEVGFDDVLYDYIRRPDGRLDDIVIPGLGDRTPEEAVVEVMAAAYPQLRDAGVWVGASVFGIAVDRPLSVAQDLTLMAPHLDYVAPMVYPNHWNPGEHGVADPEGMPYDIVERSLTLFHEVLEPTGTALVPWLQDFGGYGETEVRAQIDATEAVTGERSFLLWSSGVSYTEEALDPIPGRPTSLPEPDAGDPDGAEPGAEEAGEG